MKKFKHLWMLLAFSILMAMPSFADYGWRKDDKGWWYASDRAEGGYLKSIGIYDDSGEDGTYYFDATGYMVTNQWVGNRYFGADGAETGYAISNNNVYIGPNKYYVRYGDSLTSYDFSYHPGQKYGSPEVYFSGNIMRISGNVTEAPAFGDAYKAYISRDFILTDETVFEAGGGGEFFFITKDRFVSLMDKGGVVVTMDCNGQYVVSVMLGP